MSLDREKHSEELKLRSAITLGVEGKVWIKSKAG